MLGNVTQCVSTAMKIYSLNGQISKQVDLQDLFSEERHGAISSAADCGDEASTRLIIARRNATIFAGQHAMTQK